MWVRMRFHIVALPHTRTTKQYCACAYTQKVRLFASMMLRLGHEVYHYGAEGSEVECTEHITAITAAEQERFFGHNDWHKRMFDLKWDINQSYWKIMNHRAAAEIIARKQRGDFLCLIGGTCQKPIADAVGDADVITVEPGVGYYGVFAKFCAFESYTHQAAVYHTLSKNPNGRLYDAVIPNYYDPEDFPLCAEKGDYLLFLGRAIQRKGIQIAVDTARAVGMKLIMAGQGVESITAEKMVCEGGYTVNVAGVQVEHIGYVDVSKRAEVLGGAKALLLPTLYIEPFGGAAVEAQLCGTPAITTDFGAFAETVKHGVTGWRCRTLRQFVQATQHLDQLDPAEIRRIAVERYSLERVAPLYIDWFESLAGLWGAGWPDLTEEHSTTWMNKR
jgi:glycosyltransferase involved in cell wall biosynthesis